MIKIITKYWQKHKLGRIILAALEQVQMYEY